MTRRLLNTRKTFCGVWIFLMVFGLVLGWSAGDAGADDGDDEDTAAEVADDTADDGPEIRFGGALRFNWFYKTWDDTNQNKASDIALDTFRLEADGSYKDLLISAEYRFYSGYHMLHHGYIGWQASDATKVLFGVHQVPFGIQPYSSHNWFFDVGYYVGLEDDYDLGIQTITEKGNWSLKAAFYKNDEGHYTGDSLDSARYSYDIVNAYLPSPEGQVLRRNEEINQFNLRYAYTFEHSESSSTEIGISAQYGGVYNAVTEDTGSHQAFNLHLNGTYGRWSIHAAAMTYDHDLENPTYDPDAPLDGATNHPFLEEDRVVAFGAYDAPYWIAANGDIALFNVAYNSGLTLGPFESLTFYNNASILLKAEDGFEDTIQNVLGVAGAAGPLYCYLDIAMGKNHPWIGGDWSYGLAFGDPDADWEIRYNLNVGYYF
jgi:hypothetical protein